MATWWEKKGSILMVASTVIERLFAVTEVGPRNRWRWRQRLFVENVGGNPDLCDIYGEIDEHPADNMLS
jgi:hypothetical protein